MKKLENILSGISGININGTTDIPVSNITFDSRDVSENTAFIAVKGTQVDGHNFIDKAIEAGANAIICETLPEKTNNNVTYVVSENTSNLLGKLASNFYDNPSQNLKLVGVTGTNGKTTIATLLFKLFKDLGYKAGLLSTIKYIINDEEFNSTHTTPDAIAINKLLKEMVDAGCDYCFMEVSSHSIVQERISGLDFQGGIFTNITHDHLDYHVTFKEYINAKKMFFDNLSNDAFAITNIDDKNGEYMLQNTKANKYSYSLRSMSDFKAKILESHFSGLMLNLDGHEFWCKLIGKFNAYNILAIYSTAILLEQDKIEVLTTLSKLEAVDGRFQYYTSKNNVIGIVDYAHTPDALENVLNTINDIRSGQETLITVVGCGGDRDKTKRPIMANIACVNSDKVILTSDNPRSEEPEAILKDMQEGVEVKDIKKVLSIVNRAEAIKTAVSIASENDIILVAGKGHETYQIIKGVTSHFDDKEELLNNFKIFEN